MDFREAIILDKLVETLNAAGLSLIPERGVLLDRIRIRMEETPLNQTKKEDTNDREFTSPVCFAASEEVQADYQNENYDLKQIDEYIDRLILGEEA
ncbi:hypothetical protein [Algoriphagus chordae]|uniref:Uncharacterized protein n=1 Tax=Algoriphagus chordae TaxID=237019 RepID=A0A2W7RBW3_9BACT|nr:hypothetical protein [Algoriphagus chordae]PZX55780.1 hypothetical protein LV85_01005 [Algoriphagus chordae]